MQERKLSPAVSENMSIMSPIKNPIVRSILVDASNGSIIIIYINTKAMAQLNRIR